MLSDMLTETLECHKNEMIVLIVFLGLAHISIITFVLLIVVAMNRFNIS